MLKPFIHAAERGELHAHILGDCSECGAAMRPAICTSTNTQNGETETYEMLVCSTNITHTLIPSDAPSYTPPTTDKAS